MAEEIFKIKQGDRRPYLEGQLVRRNFEGEVEGPQDISGGTVVFTMVNKATNLKKVNRGTAVIDDAAEGLVHYEWQDGDTDTAGSFLGEFEVVYTDEPETFPNGKAGIPIKITAQLG